MVKQAIASDSALSGTILISAEQLARERPELANRARFRLLPTPAARPTEDIERTDGMLMASVAPILDDQRVIVGYLFGGHLLNRRNDVVDKIKSEVFAGETFEYEDVGTVTIFQEDLRIATNVLDDDGLRAVGTRLSDPVYRDVLQQGRVWSAPAFVVNEWYITAYGPVRIPMIALSAPFTWVCDEHHLFIAATRSRRPFWLRCLFPRSSFWGSC